MKKNKNVKNWISCWESHKGPFDHMPDLEMAETWNSRWGRTENGISKQLAPGKKKKRMKEIFELLDEAGFKVNGARILDIGCGPGAASIPFAEAGAKVTALDISSTALERLQAYAEKKKLDIKTIECSWWSANIDKLGLRNKFDLVFVTSTPAVRNVECFDRMIQCSNEYCYYSFFIRNHGHGQMVYDDALREILKKEGHRNSSGKNSPFINAFVYIYLMGYRPLVRINHNKRNISMSWEEAADHTIKSLERNEPCTAAVKRKIREYYKTSAVEGKYEARHSGYSGMMVWKVK